jgi:hypothetical protein
MGPGVIVIYAPLCSFHLALSADAKHIVFLVYSLAVENTSETYFVWDMGEYSHSERMSLCHCLRYCDIDAVKPLEGGSGAFCQSMWLVNYPEEQWFARLLGPIHLA